MSEGIGGRWKMKKEEEGTGEEPDTHTREGQDAEGGSGGGRHAGIRERQKKRKMEKSKSNGKVAIEDEKANSWEEENKDEGADDAMLQCVCGRKSTTVMQHSTG